MDRMVEASPQLLSAPSAEPITRRDAIQCLSGAAAVAWWGIGSVRPAANAAAWTTAEAGLTLGFSTYGLPKATTSEALRAIAQAGAQDGSKNRGGYDSAEIAVIADRDAAPERLSMPARRELARLVEDLGLRLTSLMENLSPLGEWTRHQSDLERLRRAAELAHDLCPGRPPHVQSVLGGKPERDVRSVCRDRLADWLRVAEHSQTVVCIKPHRAQALSRADDAAWVLGQLGNSPWLRMVYDPSHFALREFSLAESIRFALPVTAQIAVKDVVEHEGTFRFALPGETGTIDYPALLRQFYEGGFRGDICVEVSSQVSSSPDYDPAAALGRSLANLERALAESGIARRRKA